MSTIPVPATSSRSIPLGQLVPAWLWLVLGVVFTALVANRFQLALLAWVAPVPWLLYLRQTSGWRSRLVFLGALQLGMALQIAKIITDPLPWVFVPMFSVPMGLSAGVLFVLFEAWRRRLGDRWGLVLFPALATASEWVGWRSSDFGSWGASAYNQLDNLALLQTVSLFGMGGIAWLTAAVGVWVALVLVDEQPRRWLRWGVALALMVGAAHAYGAARLMSVAQGPHVTVAAVVTDVGLSPTGLPSAEELAQANDTLFERSKLAADRGAELVVWNEGATAVQAVDESAFLDRGQRLATSRGIDLVLAYVVPLEGMGKYENKYVWLSPEGEVETYFKHEPVPGEGAVKGTAPLVVHQRPWGMAAGAICYDYDFPTLSMEQARQGADLVFVPSSDWAGIDPTHTWMARVRGIEGGHAVLRPVRWATSAAFDAFGRPLATMPWQDSERVMLARVPMGSVDTVYSRVGDVLPWGCVLVLLAGLVGLLRRR